MHHDGQFDLTYPDDLPNPERVHEIVFEVVSLRITRRAEWSWLSHYQAKIIATK